MSETNEEIYKNLVIEYLQDQDSPGEIDVFEREMLRRKKQELNINDSVAKKIEDQLKISYGKKTPCSIKNFEKFEAIIQKNKDKNSQDELHKKITQLRKDLETYGSRLSQFEEIEIQEIFNEGKTGAIVFKIKGKKHGVELFKILKYDYFPRIMKEFTGFTDKERLHGRTIPTNYKPHSGNEGYQHGFLEFQPADNFTNAIKMLSLKKVVTSREIYNFLSGGHIMQRRLTRPLEQVVDSLVTSFYSPIISKEEPFQNSLEQFLPPREVRTGKIEWNTSNTNNDNYFTKVKAEEIIDYNLYPNETTGKSNATFKLLLDINGYKYRIDADVEIKSDKVLQNLSDKSKWILSIDRRTQKKDVRKHFIGKIAQNFSFLEDKLETFKLSPIFRENAQSQVDYDTHLMLDQLLKNTGKVYSTNCLHGDLNPSNILLCKLSTGLFDPILIDFYDTGLSGNAFYDLARLETELVIYLLSNELKVRFNLHDESKIHSEEVIKFILKNEELLFALDQKENLFTGDFLLFEFRKILSKVMKNTLKVSSADWFKNYLACVGIFGLKYNKFQESELNKTIAILWSLRAFHRFENYQSNMEVGIEKEAQNDIEEDNPLTRLKEQCKKESNINKKTLGIEPAINNVFVDFFEAERYSLKAFLDPKQNSNCLVLTGESGSGKSTFLDHYMSTDESLYPILLIAGNSPIEDKKHFIDTIQKSLGSEYQIHDWIKLLEYNLEYNRDNKQLCVIIESIYYNPDVEKAIKALEEVILEICQTNKIKLILPVTPSFWNEYLAKNRRLKGHFFTPDINNEKDNDICFLKLSYPNMVNEKELLEKYFSEYNIEGELVGKAKNLPKVPGFLKLFCESETGGNIGRLDHIFLTKIIEKYIEITFKKIFNHNPKMTIKNIAQLFYELSVELLENKKTYFFTSQMLEEKFIKITQEPKEWKSFQNYIIQLGFIVGTKQKLQFRFLEVIGYILANRRVNNWIKNETNIKAVINWLDESLKKVKKEPIYEIYIYYVLTLLYNRDFQKNDYDFKLFNHSIENLLEKFADGYSKYGYGLLRIFTRSLSSLPKVNSRIMQNILNLEKIIKNYQNKVHDTSLEQEYARCFNLLDDNLVYDQKAIEWIRKFEKFEKVGSVDMIKKTFGSQSFKWLDFRDFLKEDYARNSNFIRNYLEPALDKISSSLRDHSNLDLRQESYVFNLSKELFDLNKRSLNKFGKFETKLYEILFQLVEIHDDELSPLYRKKALELIEGRKIYDPKLFSVVIRGLSKYNEYDNIPAYHWLKFLMKYHDFDENQIDHQAYLQLEKMISSLKYNLLDRRLRQELDNYIIDNPPELMIPLVKKMRLSPMDLRKFLPRFKSYPQNIETQNVINIIIKYKNQLLLRRNEKWNDFNWIGGQVLHDYEDDEIRLKKATELVQEKIKIDPTEFELKFFSKPNTPMERYSRRRRKRVKYKSTFYYLTVKKPYTWTKLKDDPNHKLFDIAEITERVNPEIASSVKEVIERVSIRPEIFANKIRDVWTK